MDAKVLSGTKRSKSTDFPLPEICSASRRGTSSLYSLSNSVQRAEWIRWLSQYPFKWYVTLTFPRINNREANALGMLTSCVHRFEKTVFGGNLAGKTPHHRLSMVVFPEKHASGGYHFHCLVQPPTEAGKFRDKLLGVSYTALLRKIWEEVGGSFRQFDCQVVPSFQDTVKLTDYSTKTFPSNIDCINITWFRKRSD